jgi:hypothetical protein
VLVGDEYFTQTTDGVWFSYELFEEARTLIFNLFESNKASL